VSVLLLGATLGTATSPALTSLVVEQGSSHAALVFSSGCYVVLLMLVLLARRWRPAKEE
jgi:fucose permease